MGCRRTEARKQKRAEQSIAAARAPDDPIETLIARSRKLRARGEARRALVLLRQACALDEWRARSWTLLDVNLARFGAADEARQALHQARWLRTRAGEGARAAVTARLVEGILSRAA
jgi:hypothetical protein